MWQDDGTVNWHDVIARLTHWVRQRVRHPADADDLVQDILERLVLHEERLPLVENPLGWMHRIATNTIIDHYRRPQRHVALPEVLPAATEATTEVAREALAGCIRPLVMQLDPPSREALLATDLGGTSQVDAAREAGIAVSTLKSRIQRGRLKLRDALLRCCRVELDRRHAVMDCSHKQTAGGTGGTCCEAKPACPPPRSPCLAAVADRVQRGGAACRSGEAEA